MRLDQEFTIPTDLERAWELLLDVERIAPCFPGATVISVDGQTVNGAVKVKLGPILLTYNGVLEFVERDDIQHRVVMDGQGSDAKGNGSASTQVTAHLTAAGPDVTQCSLVTELNVTGRPAQFGRGMMLEVGNNILGKFSTNLAASLAAQTQPTVEALPAAAHRSESDPSEVSVETITPAPLEAEPLDLLGFARGAALKRAVPLVVGIAAVAVLIIWWAR